jgi:hypothetical protein
VADANGYVGSVALMLARYFARLDLEWSAFLGKAAYATCGLGLIGVLLAGVLLTRRARRSPAT